MFEAGDKLFLKGDGLIEKWTFSDVRHVGDLISPTEIFETDIWMGKARVNPLAKYNGRQVLILRWTGPDPEHYKAAIPELAKKYAGAPYSALDIVNNFWTGFLHPKLRRPIVQFLGNKKFMICSELSGRLTYEASGQFCFKGWESYEPVDLLEDCCASGFFTVSYVGVLQIPVLESPE